MLRFACMGKIDTIRRVVICDWHLLNRAQNRAILNKNCFDQASLHMGTRRVLLKQAREMVCLCFKPGEIR